MLTVLEHLAIAAPGGSATDDDNDHFSIDSKTGLITSDAAINYDLDYMVQTQLIRI